MPSCPCGWRMLLRQYLGVGLVLLLAANPAMSSAKPPAALIASISPNRGSLMGGTIVTIRGVGFSQNSLKGRFVVPHFAPRPSASNLITFVILTLQE